MEKNPELDNPQVMDRHLRDIFDEYARDNDSAALLFSLQVLALAKGLSVTAEDAVSPYLNDIKIILEALGYGLSVEPIACSRHE